MLLNSKYMNYYLRLIFIILITGVSIGVMGQLNYKSGFIITLKNDSLFGMIRDGGEIRNSRVCLFKANKKSDPVKYYPGDIKSYSFIGDKYYSSKNLLIKDRYRPVFTDVLLEGKINLYYYRKNKEIKYYLEREGGNLISLLNKEVRIPIDSEVLHNQLNIAIYVEFYKDTLYSVFSDCKKVQNQLDNVAYNQKSLINISKAYINETCKGNACISYEKDLSLSKPNFGIFTGIQLSKISILESKAKSNILTTLPIGLFYNSRMTLINDRLSFQVELITNSLNYRQQFSNLSDTINIVAIKSQTIAIPFLFKYEISRNKVSPSFAVGKEMGFAMNSRATINNADDLLLHKTQKGGWFCELGLNYYLGPKISLFSNIRFQSNSNLIITKETQRATYSDAVENDLFLKEYKTSFATLYFGMKF
jgi:hypothetical protein